MLAETTSTLSQLSNLLPQIAIIAGVCGLAGWSIRGAFTKPAPAKAAATNTPSRDRSKNLEAALEKSKDSLKALKSEHEALKASAVPSASLEKANAELDTTRKSLESGTTRISALETDLKKALDTIKNLNSRANDADKAQKDRSFALENELSKARQQLAIVEARPDNTAELHTEIERLRESVAVSSRFAGEVRKREAAAQEALEKAQAQLAEMSDSSRPVIASKKIGPVASIAPVGDSDRVAAAKAEVLRLLESNKQAAALESVVSAPVQEAAADEPELAAHAVPEIPEKAPVHDDLFALEK
ncbi:MAG: hypothetical protein ABI600_18375 [Luteolibacter sp.]